MFKMTTHAHPLYSKRFEEWKKKISSKNLVLPRTRNLTLATFLSHLGNSLLLGFSNYLEEPIRCTRCA